MQPKRILIVGYFSRKNLFRRYFNTENKLANGFVRAGHHVLCFSDRDHARESNILGSQKFGVTKMQRKLIETANHYKPHLIVFGHADLIKPETYDDLRAKCPGVRLAAFNVDPIFRTKTMRNFADRSRKMDCAFLTSADREMVKPLNIPAGQLFFMPNPVDSSMETARVFDVPRGSLRLDGQFLGTGIDLREEQIDAIRSGLPTAYRFESGGKAFATKRVDSTAYLDRLAEAAVCPNLPLDDTRLDLIAYLYSSDRIAQTLGQGVTTLTIATGQMSDLYEDGVVEYRDRQDLVSKMIALYENDSERRRIGEIGHRIAHDRTNATRVASYILAVSLGESEGSVPWPTVLNDA